ncbi:hypothetical protein MN608_06862 [Microdochium nivale]|nr:hypothetical protein MN608_06862 [Microdochium nivale]
MARLRQPIQGPESSWRLVEGGENDSFDTSIVNDFEDEDSLLPSHPPSQLSSSSQGLSFRASQDSNLSDRENQLLSHVDFRPSLASTRQPSIDEEHTPVPEFFMPKVDMDRSPQASSRPSRTVTRASAASRSDASGDRYPYQRRGYGQRGRDESPDGQHDRGQDRKQRHDPRYGGQPTTLADRFTASVPSFIFNVAAWLLSVIGMAFSLAKFPIAIALFIWITVGLSMSTLNTIKDGIAASPICKVPFITPSFCDVGGPSFMPGNGSNVEFDGLMAVQANFEKVLEASAEGVSLPMEMKRSETSVRDLRTMVKYSDIPARSELVYEFDGYIETVSTLSRDLQTFNTHVGSAVDSIISINRWTSRYIDTMAAARADEHSGAVARFTGWVFSPFAPAVFDERILLDKYIEHTGLVSDKIANLILEAQANLRLLSQAENNLQVIKEHVVRSEQDVVQEKDSALWTLWTLVGANRPQLNRLNSQLDLLKLVDRQRTSAVVQLVNLVHDLGDIQSKLSDLRDRVAAPEVVGAGEAVGVGGRVASIPLSVHIETINAGVERLEGARSRIRAEENERLQRALARARDEDHNLIDA